MTGEESEDYRTNNDPKVFPAVSIIQLLEVPFLIVDRSNRMQTTTRRRTVLVVLFLLFCAACESREDVVLRGRTPRWYLAGEDAARNRYSIYNEEVTRTRAGTYLIWLDKVTPDRTPHTKRTKQLVEFDCRNGSFRISSESEFTVPRESDPWAQAPPMSSFRRVQRVACDAVKR